jgi:hypothetical protein
MFSLLLPLVFKLFQVDLECESCPHWCDEDIEMFVHFWLVIISVSYSDPKCFCCTTPSDVIFVKKYL